MLSRLVVLPLWLILTAVMSISMVGLFLFVVDDGKKNTWLAIGRHLSGLEERE